MIRSYHCVIEGKVRGGNLQSWALDQAQALGLGGWIRFVSDDKAEILLQGDSDKYRSFKDLLAAEAPIPERRSVNWEIIDYDKEHAAFELRG
jgi:acylphosphatase